MYIIMAVPRHNSNCACEFELSLVYTTSSYKRIGVVEPGHRTVCRMAGNCYGTTPSENSEKSQFVTGYNMYKQFEQT